MTESALPPDVRKILEQHARPGMTAGLIGHGSFGRLVREYLQAHGVTVLIFDPQQALLDAEEEYDDTLTQWGNGMGGCTTERSAHILYFPLEEVLRRADFICVQTPPDAAAEVLALPSVASFARRKPVLDFSQRRRYA